jgi:hypothetical protein
MCRGRGGCRRRHDPQFGESRRPASHFESSRVARVPRRPEGRGLRWPVAFLQLVLIHLVRPGHALTPVPSGSFSRRVRVPEFVVRRRLLSRPQLHQQSSWDPPVAGKGRSQAPATRLPITESNRSYTNKAPRCGIAITCRCPWHQSRLVRNAPWSRAAALDGLTGWLCLSKEPAS